MTGKNNRINIMLDDASLKVIDDLAAATGDNRSSLIRGLIREATPQLIQLINKINDIKSMAQEDREVQLKLFEKVASKLDDNVKKGIDYLGN